MSYLLYIDPGQTADKLSGFSHDLSQFTMSSSLQELASLKYCDQPSSCSIVSSIEFDRDCELFAVAGVTKRIKVGVMCETMVLF